MFFRYRQIINFLLESRVSFFTLGLACREVAVFIQSYMTSGKSLWDIPNQIIKGTVEKTKQFFGVDSHLDNLNNLLKDVSELNQTLETTSRVDLDGIVTQFNNLQETKKKLTAHAGQEAEIMKKIDDGLSQIGISIGEKYRESLLSKITDVESELSSEVSAPVLSKVKEAHAKLHDIAASRNHAQIYLLTTQLAEIDVGINALNISVQNSCRTYFDSGIKALKGSLYAIGSMATLQRSIQILSNEAETCSLKGITCADESISVLYYSYLDLHITLVNSKLPNSANATEAITLYNDYVALSADQNSVDHCLNPSYLANITSGISGVNVSLQASYHLYINNSLAGFEQFCQVIPNDQLEVQRFSDDIHAFKAEIEICLLTPSWAIHKVMGLIEQIPTILYRYLFNQVETLESNLSVRPLMLENCENFGSSLLEDIKNTRLREDDKNELVKRLGDIRMVIGHLKYITQVPANNIESIPENELRQHSAALKKHITKLQGGSGEINEYFALKKPTYAERAIDSLSEQISEINHRIQQAMHKGIDIIQKAAMQAWRAATAIVSSLDLSHYVTVFSEQLKNKAGVSEIFTIAETTLSEADKSFEVVRANVSAIHNSFNEWEDVGYSVADTQMNINAILTTHIPSVFTMFAAKKENLSAFILSRSLLIKIAGSLNKTSNAVAILEEARSKLPSGAAEKEIQRLEFSFQAIQDHYKKLLIRDKEMMPLASLFKEINGLSLIPSEEVQKLYREVVQIEQDMKAVHTEINSISNKIIFDQVQYVFNDINLRVQKLNTSLEVNGSLLKTDVLHFIDEVTSIYTTLTLMMSGHGLNATCDRVSASIACHVDKFGVKRFNACKMYHENLAKCRQYYDIQGSCAPEDSICIKYLTTCSVYLPDHTLSCDAYNEETHSICYVDRKVCADTRASSFTDIEKKKHDKELKELRNYLHKQEDFLNLSQHYWESNFCEIFKKDDLPRIMRESIKKIYRIFDNLFYHNVHSAEDARKALALFKQDYCELYACNTVSIPYLPKKKENGCDTITEKIYDAHQYLSSMIDDMFFIYVNESCAGDISGKECA